MGMSESFGLEWDWCIIVGAGDPGHRAGGDLLGLLVSRHTGRMLGMAPGMPARDWS